MRQAADRTHVPADPAVTTLYVETDCSNEREVVTTDAVEMKRRWNGFAAYIVVAL